MSDLTTLHSDRLWTLACRSGRLMYDIAGTAFSDNTYQAERVRRSCIGLTTAIAEAHAADHVAMVVLHLQSAQSHASELGHYLSVAERFNGIGPFAFAEARSACSEMRAELDARASRYLLQRHTA